MDWCGWNFRHETHLWSEHSYWALTSMLTSLLVCVWTFICLLCLQVSQTGGLQLSTVCLCHCVPALKSHNSKFVCVSLGCMSVSQLLIYISVSPSVSCPVSIFVFVYVGLGWRPRSPCAWQRPKPSPSLDMPTSKHFCSRQYWQRLRVTLLIWQFLSRWQVYTMFFWILRRKKPCNRHPRESE